MTKVGPIQILKITVVPNVDLIVSNITFTPTEISDGDIVIFNATIINNGTDNATDFYVRFEVDGKYIGRKLISSLSAGANITITQNWIAYAGTHNVSVYVDEYNAITESDETNNKISEDLPFIQFPDLTVTNITWTPTDIVGGDRVTFTATVKNIGAGNTSRDFYVRFEVDGKYIGHAKVSDGLDSVSSTDVTQTWTATWANTVNVSVDEYDAVAESDETNNKMSKNLPGLPFPDLIVTYLTWELKEDVSAGDPVTFTATIENTGGTFYSTMSNPLKIAFLVNDEYVGSRNIVGGIRAGQPLNTIFTWIAQPGTNPTICVIADYFNIIPESNETNNEYVETLTLVIKSPDLTITQLTFEPTGSIHVGDTVKFTAKVENIGEGDYSGNFDIGFYVNNTYVGVSHAVGGVSAGESIFSTFNWTASSCSNPVIKAEADFFDFVQESDEDNNEKTETLPASIPYADLEISDINWTPIENIKDRDPVTFNVTVKNNGPENVVTDFKVYFDIDGYFTRTSVISGGLAAGDSKTTSFTWKATPGDGHNATAKVDPENIVPESDETNNERMQLLPFNVSLVEIFEVRVKPAEITTGIGGQTSCEIKINNYGSASGNFDINVSGLDSDWYTFSETSVFLSAGQEEVIDLIISVPEACENNGTFPFEISVASQETRITRQGSSNLIVEPTPIIHDLLPKDGASIGSDDVIFSWNTHINASTTIYLKSEDETAYTSYTGAEGQLHTVVVSDLTRNKNYSYYAESASPCGTFNSTVRTFYVGNGISFTQDVYEFTVERDYDQLVTIGVRNTDNEYHELLVGVPTTYEDLVLGFVGDGSKDNIIPLNPGKSKDITLAVHLQDAMKEDYELMANLTSTRGDEILTDTARIKIHVHVPRIDYDIEEISVDEITLMGAFRLANKGDPITDLTVSVADNLKGNAYIEPVIEHYRLGGGASVEFNVVPILSSPDFQPASPVPPVEGDITVNAAGIEAEKTVRFTVPEGKQPYKATVSSPGVINIGRVKTWHCNNKPNTKTSVDVHSGAKDKVRDDPLTIRFSSPGWDVEPHDLYISINGHEVGSLINTVPDGYYKFEVDPSFLIYPERGVAKNYIELHSVHQNGGHYAVSSDMEVRLNLENYETWVIASSQEEANQIAADNLPPGFYESPDSITIGDVEISPEAGGSAVLGAASATPQVYLGKETTVQTTAEPHLDVDARFSNGDGAVHLTEVGNGVYRGRWTPRQPGDSSGNCVITIRAKGSGVQSEKTQTAEIINPTKLKVEILEPEEGFTASVGDAIDVSVKVTRTDDHGREYGPPDSFEIDLTARFDIGSSPTSLTACEATYTTKDSGGGLTGSNDGNNVIAERPGECYITAAVVDNTGNRGSDSVSGKVEVEIFLQVIYPLSNFEVLEYYGWTKGGPAQRIRVKVMDSDLKGVRDAQVTAEITAPNDAPQFYPEGEAGIYYADWKPKPNGERPLSCTIKLSAKKKFDFDEVAAHPQQVTGTVDPVIKITDIKPKGVYHRTSKGYIPLPTGGLRGNTYDPLWDDKPVNPTDDDYVAFTYKLNKDVDEVIITEYKDVTLPFPNEFIRGRTYLGGCEQAHEGTHEYYMNVKDFDEDPYFIEIATRKKYDTSAGKETEEEDEDSDVNLQIERGSFGQIYIEKVADVPVGTMTEDEFKNSENGQRIFRWIMNGGIIPTVFGTLVGVATAPAWVPGAAVGLTLSIISTFIDFDDLDSLGAVRETWPNGNLKRLDRAESVRFTGRWYEWDGAKYHSGGAPDSWHWLRGEFIYSNLYRVHYDQYEKGRITGAEFLDLSPHDFLAKKFDNTWRARFYRTYGDEYVPWLAFQGSRFLDLHMFWGWSVPEQNRVAPNNIYYSMIYFKQPWGTSYYVSERGDRNPLHGTDTINLATGMKNTMTSESTSGNAAFNGIYADHGTDSDSDGLYDALTLEVGLNVTSPGYYTICGLLADANGAPIGMETNGGDLASGAQTLELNFNGMSIHQNGVNGTFSLIYLALYGNGDQIDYSFDYSDGIYTTAVYDPAEFQEPSVSFTDTYSEEMTDTDGDGLYDYLTINVELNVSEAENYTIAGWLSGDGYKSFVQSVNSFDLETGLHEIQLSFDGTIIRQKGVDGQYSLNVAVYDESLHILGHKYDAYITSAHDSSDFQRTAAEFSNIYSDHGTDTNTDGLYDYLTIDVGVNVIKAGNYTLSGQLVDSAGIFVVGTDIESSLDVGAHTLSLNFDGLAIRQRGVDGAFNLTAVLSDESGRVDTGEYTTSVYSSADFQAAPAEFSGDYSDYGTDTSGDGLFDCLTIEVGIDVMTAGDYGIGGMLYDQNGAYVGSASSYLSLDNGIQTGQLDFDGQTIREHGLNGPYNLTSLTLYDESGKQIDYQDMAYTTSAYSYTDFQTPFVEFNDIFSDQGTDIDGDGKYNYLTVEVGVTVTTPGNYAITGTLNDCNGNHTVWVVNHTSLDVGAQTVQLNFDGQTIRQHCVDGPYNLTCLEIYDADVRDIDRRDDVYTTSAYSYTDFEIPSAQLNDIFSDHGTDLDDDGLYDHLTVDIGVNVTEAGNYSLEGRLADNNGNFIVSDYNYTTGLDTGSQTIQLNFDGLVIRMHGMDGPYYMRNLRLCDESGDTIDSRTDAYTTSAYNYTQFEGYPVDLRLLESDIAFDPETPVAGETVIITATIHNTGTDDISSVAVQFFDGDPDAGGVQIGADQTISSIAHESTGTAQVAWTAIPGTHDIFMRVDPYDSIPEASENNNQAHKQMTVGAIALPDLTLTSEDIQFILPSSKSTSSSSPKQTTLVDISNSYNRFIPPSFKPASLTEHTIENLSDNERTTANSHEIIRSVRPYKRSIPRGVSETGVNISSLSAPSFMIENLTYPPTVNPNQTFHVTIDTNYSFDTTTYVFAGIWDYNASEYIAETPGNETLSGTGNKSYTFNLTAPLTGIMFLSADLVYYDFEEGWWILSDYRDFTVNVTAKGNIATILATIHNIGTADARNIVVQFFDGDPNAGGIQIGSDQAISSIPAGGTGSAQVSWTAIPETHDIFVRIDPYNSIQEANENNNQAYKPITIEPTYNQPPIASFTYSPLNPVVTETITFNASNSHDPDGFIVNYEWGFGDGINTIGEVVTHSYSAAGNYYVVLTVTDNDGAIDRETKSITVSGRKTIYVDDDFTDDPANHKWDTIQEGINDANDGDIVLVYNGTYTENVVLNKRLTLTGEGMPTIDAQGSGDGINITVDNCTVKGFCCVNAHPSPYAGIHVESDNNVIEENTCKANDVGIVLLTSGDNIIANNNANSNNLDGIRLLSHSNNNSLVNNIANSNSETGILCWTSSNNIFTYNNVNLNVYGIWLHNYSTENILANNTAKDNRNTGIYLKNSNNNRIIDNDASNNDNYHGISLYLSNNNEVRNNVANYNYYQGVKLEASNENLIAKNTAKNNGNNGIYLKDSNNNEMANNTASSNNYDGIRLRAHSSNNIVTNNIANSNIEAGILCWTASDNILTYNNLSSNDWGIWLHNYSNENILANNIANSNNRYGIQVARSCNNNIYLNNFIDNTDNVYSYNSNNIWNSSETISYTYNGDTYINYLGNYWSDYKGSDTDGDGIGEDPYSIDGDKDYYPLMERFKNLA